VAVIYKRAAGALAVFTVDPVAVIYKRAVGALAVFAADPQSTVYKQTAEIPAETPDATASQKNRTSIA